MRVLCLSLVFVCLLTATALPQSPCDGYPAAKTWTAGDGTHMIHESDGGVYPGWSEGASGTYTYVLDPGPPVVYNTVAGQACQTDTDTDSKMFYETGNWVFQSTLEVPLELSVIWRVYISDAPASDMDMPAIKIYNYHARLRLDFNPRIGGLCQGICGWVESAGTEFTAGGKLNPVGNRKRFLPMAMNEWHTIRVDLHTDGTFDAWLDGGGSDWKHISGTASTDTSSPVLKIGVSESRTGTHTYSTACLAWGEGGAEIPDPPPGADEEEICDNGVDDADPDDDADCDDVDCDCSFIVPENTLDACSNGIDDDDDGAIDCADSDCAAITHCAEDQPQYVLTMVRQVGNDNNSGLVDTGFYFSVYDEQGNPLNNVTIADPLNCVSATTATSTQTSQAGHARYIPPMGGSYNFAYLGDDTAWRFYVSDDQGGGAVNSEITPEMYAWLPRPNGGPAGYYSWQIEFMRKTRKSNPTRFDPLNKVYMFDIVQMNTPAFDEEGTPLPNDFLDKDSVALYSYGSDGGSMYGQSFSVPDGVDHIISTRVQAASGTVGKLQYQVSIHEIIGDNPPDDETDLGPAIGAVEQGPLMPHNQWWDQMVVWPTIGLDAVPVTPGVDYFLRVTKVGGGDFNVWRTVDQHVPCGNQPAYTGDFYKYGAGLGVGVRKRATGEFVTGDFGNYNWFLPPHTNCCSEFYDLKSYIVGGSFEPRISLVPPAIDVAVCQTQALPNGGFTVRNTGPGTINYSITDDAGWLSAVPDGGASGGEVDDIAILYDLDGLPPGYYTATIEVTAPEAANDPQTIQVSLLIDSTQADFDKDNDVDQDDFAFLQACLNGGGAVPPGCEAADLDGNEIMDHLDYDAFENRATGPNVAVPLEYCDL